MIEQRVRVPIEIVKYPVFRIILLVLCQFASMISVGSNQVHDVSAVRSADVNMDDDVISELRSIIVSRSKEGATIEEIIDDYKHHTNENLLSIYRDREEIARYLRQINGVWSTFTPPDGPYLWYCNTQRTQHLADMIKKQKNPRINNNTRYDIPRYQLPSTPYSTSTKVSESGQREKFFEDNRHFIPKRNAWSRVQSRAVPYLQPQRRQMQQGKYTTQRRYYSNAPYTGPNFCGYQMIGDDFFLSLARWELGFAFDPGHAIQKSGLCISGLTIAEAANRVLKATNINDRVIVNVGAVDLLHGYEFVDMKNDLFQLMKNLALRGASVILTTVSPIANCSHIRGITDRLEQFNDLIREQRNSIDLWQCFVNEKKNTLYECFQPGPRYVSGSNQPHVLWNKLGRQRIIKFLKQHLAEFV
ncbi:maternal effect protein oskar-like isoform X2 [Topomyia yanbarensis]|uniref:maternal effect protein oskar-like isoform X2 n=1 Tax=Topomyia yanbarensis TaxID=2498891 RepID=UPI00273C5C64|nr:maternal effect protein oskar-like isoform X2 [Topomyia yanbarensis]